MALRAGVPLQQQADDAAAQAALMASLNAPSMPGPAALGAITPVSRSLPDLPGQGSAPMVNTTAPVNAAGRAMNPLEAHMDSLYREQSAIDAPRAAPTSTLGRIGRVFQTIGNVAGDVLAPSTMALIPGTDLNKQVQKRQVLGQIQQGEKLQTDEAERADSEQQAALRIAQAHRAQTQADAAQPVEVTPEQAQQWGMPQLAGMMLTPRDQAKLAGTHEQTQGRITVGAGHDASQQSIADDKNQAALTINGQKLQVSKEIADAHNKTQQLLEDKKAATSRANNADSNATHLQTGGGKAGVDGSFKVPADVTKRAALAANVNENADGVELILREHPDIVGAASGRYSNVQQMLGSNDPNIQALGVRMHNIALASNGAHGVRSQEAVQKTEDELFNHFRTGSEGIAGGLNATRASVKTFLDDEQNFQSTGRRTGGAPASGTPKAATGGVMYARDPSGQLHTAPAGTPLPPGWKAGK